MKKTISSLFIMGGLISVAALAGCGTSTSSAISSGAATSGAATSGAATSASSAAAVQNIHLQLVPSNDPAKLLTLATQLKPFLDSYCKDDGFTFTVDVGATYAATTTALAAGQIDGGFLTASGYAQESIENPNKVDVLLSASRAGYKVQADDFPGFDAAAKAKQLAAMNGEIGADGNAVSATNPAYSYKGDQSETQVSYYSGIIITLRDSARTALGLSKLDADGDGKTTIKEIHDAKATIGRMGATSGAGYIYPTKYLYDNGYTLGFKSKDDYNSLSADDQAKAVIGVDQTSYPNAVKLLMTGQIDAACGFMGKAINIQDAFSRPIQWTEIGKNFAAFFTIDWNYFWGNLSADQGGYTSGVFYNCIITFCITFIATSIAFFISIPLGLLASHKLFGKKAYFAEIFLILIRTFPELLLALFLTGLTGYTMFTAIFALSLHSVGMVGKLYADQIDEADLDSLEALDACGSNKMQRIKMAVMPQVFPNFLSVGLYRLDINIRTGTMLGLIVQQYGGIGWNFLLDFRSTSFSRLGADTLGIVFMIIVVDLLSSALRKKIV